MTNRKRIRKGGRAAAAVLLCLMVFGRRAATAEPVAIRPQEYDGPVRNPYKGVVSCGYFPHPREYADAAALRASLYKLMSVVNIRSYLAWRFVERSETDSKQRIINHINYLCQGYDEYNCSARFRVVTHDGWPAESVKLPSDLSITAVTNQTAYYRQRYVNLIRKIGEVLDGDPRINVVELGTGRFGEQHTPTPTAEAQSDFGDAFTTHLTRTHVCNRNLSQFTRFANFGYYNDAQFCGNSCGDSWERGLVRQYPDRWKSRPIEGEMAPNFPYGPTPRNPDTNLLDLLRNANGVRRVINVIRYDHLLFNSVIYWQTDKVLFPGWSGLTAQEKQNLFAIHKAFGYRFLIAEFNYDSRLTPGADFTVSFKVRNTGASPMYYAWPVKLALLNPATRQPVWEQAFANADVRTWLGGEGYPVDPINNYSNFESVVYDYLTPAPVHQVQNTFTLPATIPGGTYVLALSVHNPAGKPRLRFAIRNYFNGGRHPMGYVGVNTTPAQTQIDPAEFDDIFEDPFCDPGLSPQPPPPAAPGPLSATLASPGSIRLAWQDNSTNEDQFKLDRRQSGTTEWVRIATLPANTTACTDTGLPAATKCYYQLKAWNAAGGNSDYSNVADATTASAQPPAAPGGLRAVPLSSSTIRLDWTDNADDEDGFRIDRRQSGVTEWVRVATPPADAVTHTDTGLPAETKFYYKIRAYNEGGSSGDSAVVAAITQAHTRWLYRKGTADVRAAPANWLSAEFDDSAWRPAALPIGYSDTAEEGPFGTTLDDMRGRYTCVLLRAALIVPGPAQVNRLDLSVRYDDGFVLWINGQEIARVNVPGVSGTVPPFDGIATAAIEPTAWSRALTGAEIPALLAGTNVLAVQLFNAAAESSDCLFDGECAAICEPLPAATDADADGMPDAWEAVHLSDLPDPSDQTDQADPDGDGLSNLEEYVAGTDPRNGDVTFVVETHLSAGQVLVSFDTVAASGRGYDGCVRRYCLEQSVGASAAAWQPVPGFENIPGAGTTVTYRPTAEDSEPRLYRVRVWLSD
ncbi:MAG: DUF4832 domain-containing protein [Kiritimatiellae bacterium]|nr:DUF4832 domain-containing protein [Kiritimatiellia bacterium]